LENLVLNNNLITVIILTRNEELHIERAIKSALSVTSNVIIIDSNSTDNTISLANKYNVLIKESNFNNFSDKLNWCIDSIDYKTPWIVRLDADEYFSEKFINNLNHLLNNIETNVTAIFVNRQLWFMNKHIKFGGYYPNLSIRIWKDKSVFCEYRELDEHFIVKCGIAKILDLDIIDNPLFNISHWITKHNNYAFLESNSFLKKSESKHNNSQQELTNNFFGNKPERKRWIKQSLYYSLPIFIRSILHFLYRYIIRFGFLDGKRGFLFHFYHSLWFRILVDTNIYERSRKKIEN
jgi:glycosyltransferase involved in cell wall biosynthesis